MRTVLQGIDVRNPTLPSIEAVALHTLDAQRTALKLAELFRDARFTVLPNRMLLVRASAADLAQVKGILGTLDAPSPAPAPSVAANAEAVQIVQARAPDVARAVSREVAHVRADVSGSSVVLSGAPDDVARAKALVAELDVPPASSRYTAVYRIVTLDAGSVADLLSRTFPDAAVNVDKDLNALSVTATASEQLRIAAALKQLDAPAASAGGLAAGPSMAGAIGSNFEVVMLRSAVPNANSLQAGVAGGDAAAPVIQTLQELVPGIKVSALGTPGQVALIGDPATLRLARDVLAKLDVPVPLVVLDTEVLEIDEQVARNLGLMLDPPLLGTTFSEVAPPNDAVTGAAGRLGGFQPLTRTPLSFNVQLNLQVQNGNARVLADPRITTLSGRTATIRAGDTINILTTTGGGTGTVATTQLQSFQTGVTLDITPLVTSESDVNVALHPVVNSLTSILNGVPQISTRDTQTVVHLKNNETLVIGGLIQESVQKTVNKVPLLGDLPLVGNLFKNSQSSSSRNELIIVVTPHIIADGESPAQLGVPLPAIPTPRPLPTLMPNATLPPARATPEPASHVAENSTARAPTPTPTPTAAPSATSPVVSTRNTFEYGHLPASNVARPGDAPQIFYAGMQPTLVTNGASIAVVAMTTTNVTKVSLAYGSVATTLSQTGPGIWQATFPFATTALPPGQARIQATLTAARPDGTNCSLLIPVTVNI